MGDLTTLAKVKEFLGIGDTATDAVLTTLVSQVSAAVEAHCRRTFADTNYTEHHDGDLAREIPLRQYPIISITSVHEDPARTFAASALISSDDYTFNGPSGILLIDYRLPRGNRNVKVVYRAGYATLPPDVVLATNAWVGAIYNRRKSGGSMSESLGNFSTSYEVGPMPADVAKMLDSYVMAESSIA